MVRRLILLLILVPTAIIGSAVPASAGHCGYQADPAPAQKIAISGWGQRQLGLERLHKVQTGAGIRVAVIDTGADASHPQLVKAADSGWDAITGSQAGRVDCNSSGHGTAIASLIAARPDQGTSLVGVAPGATIVPMRVSDNAPNTVNPVAHSTLATAVRQAIALRASVIHISYALRGDNGDLKAAIAEALKANIVVVAAAGDGITGETYPAAYDGVVGVGAIAASGARMDSSSTGRHVDIVAPGEGLVAAARVSGHGQAGNTAAAAALVSGAAALLRAAQPQWTNKQVAQQLLATADGTAGGEYSPGFGYGAVNPYRALTEQAAPAGVSPTWTPVPQELKQTPAQPQWPATWRRALIWSAALLLLAALAAIGYAVALSYLQRHRISG